MEGRSEDKKKKLMEEQYQRYHKYNIIKNMSFCIENRLPKVKQKLFEASSMLVAFYFPYIDLEMEDFYLNLAEEINKVEKYDEQLALSLLKYMQILVVSLLKLGNINKNS